MHGLVEWLVEAAIRGNEGRVNRPLGEPEGGSTDGSTEFAAESQAVEFASWRPLLTAEPRAKRDRRGVEASALRSVRGQLRTERFRKLADRRSRAERVYLQLVIVLC